MNRRPWPAVPPAEKHTLWGTHGHIADCIRAHGCVCVWASASRCRNKNVRRPETPGSRVGRMRVIQKYKKKTRKPGATITGDFQLRHQRWLCFGPEVGAVAQTTIHGDAPSWKGQRRPASYREAACISVFSEPFYAHTNTMYSYSYTGDPVTPSTVRVPRCR